MRIILLSCLFVLGVRGSPQTEVTADDILNSANDATRYGGNKATIDQGILDDVFGPGNSGKSTIKQKVDVTAPHCAEYAYDGYKCVPYYQCEDGEIVTDGGGLIDIRGGFLNAILDPGSSKCEGYLEVCCRNPNFDITLTTPAPPKPVIPKVYVPKCGRHNVNGIGVRIDNSKYEGTTQFGEWPHMCAILEKKKINNGEEINLYACGGSLIAPGIILTAAHCVQKIPYEKIKVRCGEWDTQQVIEPYPHEDRDVHKVAIHPTFNPKNLENDYALLFLTTEFILSSHIDTICLPDNNAGGFSYIPNNCVATGWGKDQFGKEGAYQVVMKQVHMNMVDNYECEKRLRKTRLGEGFLLDPSFVCAGGEKNKDTCKGDGGGPLICPLATAPGYSGEITYVQTGIVSWGVSCGVDGTPGVYASVTQGLCFIDFATRCYLGNSNYFGIKNCEHWATKSKRSLEIEVEILEQRFIGISQDPKSTPSNVRNIQRRITKAKYDLKAFTDFLISCVHPEPILNEKEEQDLAYLARTAADSFIEKAAAPPTSAT